MFIRVSLILIHYNFDRKGSLRRCGPGKPWQRLGAGDDAVGSVREEHGGNVHLNIVRAWWQRAARLICMVVICTCATCTVAMCNNQHVRLAMYRWGACVICTAPHWTRATIAVQSPCTVATLQPASTDPAKKRRHCTRCAAAYLQSSTEAIIWGQKLIC